MRAIAAGVAMVLMTGSAHAATVQCYYPKECADVMYGSYEVGAGNSISNHVKFTCRHVDGSVSTYVAWLVNGWGLVGPNRVGNDGTRVDFAKGNDDKFVCK